MYRKQVSPKASPSLRSTPISPEISPSPSCGSLSSVVQRVQEDPNSVSDHEKQQLESAIGSRSTRAILAGKQTQWVPEFQGISAQLLGDSGQVGAPIQAKAKDDLGVSQVQPENQTRLPNNLKAGIENLSGIGIDDVRVHYNSSKPAHLKALAYTQGTDIHIAPGQEQHLPHEAWHVVQQKQGRVKPTMQMKGNVNVNDDEGLEKEADVMGGKANRMGSFRQKAFESKSRAGQSLIVDGLSPHQVTPIGGVEVIQMKPKRNFGANTKPKKQHPPKRTPLIINYVWLGNHPFGPLEKFNLYCWRALGHEVNIYSYPFAGVVSHTLGSLGLEQDDAELIQLEEILGMDDNVVGDTNPKALLSDARSILRKWLKAIPEEGEPSPHHIYNMVDLTKSYIGGTRKGIVLDAKVGPSVHLQDYADNFSDKLISYTRGGNTGALPENQSIGTMQESDEPLKKSDEPLLESEMLLRQKYAKNFNAKVKSLAKADHNKAWFNELTGYHGRSYEQTKKWLDVATKTPSGGEVGKEFEVGEIGPQSHGPFRVFKRATDQTNKNGLKTTDQEVTNLIDYVFEEEIKHSGGDEEFIRKALAAKKEHHAMTIANEKIRA
ncbi:eCIS core domain-containing protein [Nodularia sp. NIES-3585]|uniref:eCIS core domain-containing protein n=1 Tax=Nodularia sp. NIES-3585 TaxID=1973477 RepID=UPI000B6C5CC5|nr:DUF4157 domain-containing protein [Nodularia sp. NIES-3585]GAX37248.1 hypothetical protein NIES3585_32910 [Nodularia sp. NIES-3585]